MNLLIRADASTRMGSGHVMRCLALAQACRGQGGRVRFACAEIPPALEARLRSEGMDPTAVPPPAAGPGDMARTAALAREMDAEWVVLDGYQFGPDSQEAMKGAGFKLLSIDDYGHARRYVSDLVLNQNICAAPGLYQERAPETHLLLGTRYVLLRREFWPWRGGRRRVAPEARTVLVTMGGSDPGNVTLGVIDALTALNNARLDVRIVVGHGNPHLAVLEEAVTAAPCPMRLLKDVEDMAGVMAGADIAVSSGGSTSWELLLMGLPGVLLALAANQDPIAAGLEQAGAALTCRAPAPGDGSLRIALEGLIGDPQKRQTIVERGYDLVDGYGAARVLSAMAMSC